MPLCKSDRRRQAVPSLPGRSLGRGPLFIRDTLHHVMFSAAAARLYWQFNKWRASSGAKLQKSQCPNATNRTPLKKVHNGDCIFWCKSNLALYFSINQIGVGMDLFFALLRTLVGILLLVLYIIHCLNLLGCTINFCTSVSERYCSKRRRPRAKE